MDFEKALKFVGVAITPGGLALGVVETAMKSMGDCLKGSCQGCRDLQHSSLGVAHACRRLLADSWGVPDWRC